MQRKWTMMMAAALAVGGAGLVGQVWAQNQAGGAAERQTTVQQREADRDVGDTLTQGLEGTAEAPDAEGIRDTLASATEAALTKGGFNDLVERFVDADRNRLGQAMPEDEQLTALHDTAARIRDGWKTKYNGDFDIEDEERVFADAKIRQGEIGENAQVVGGQIVITGTDRARPDMTTGADQGETARPAAGQDVNEDEDRNLEAGRNVAVVTVPASHGLPEIRVPLIQERPDNWRIDVPDTLTADVLRMNLQRQLDRVQQMQAQWPADENQAYTHVTHAVLLALFDGSPAVQRMQQMEGQLREQLRENQPGMQNQPGMNQPQQRPQNQQSQPGGMND